MAEAVCLAGTEAPLSSSPLCFSSDLCDVSAGGAKGPRRTVVLLANSEAQRMEVPRREWAAGFIPQGHIKQPKNLYPLPGII